MKPSDLNAPEYNLEQTGLKRMIRSPGVATVVLTTSLLIAQQFIIESKGNPYKRNIDTGNTTLPVPTKAPVKSDKILQRTSMVTELTPSFVLRNPEICTFLNRWIADDTNELVYDALKKEIATLQSPEHNTQATIASIRREIYERIHDGGTNSRALMEGLTTLLEEQRRVEKLSDAFNALHGPEDIDKMNAAIAQYNEAGGGMIGKKDWEDYAVAIEQDRKMTVKTEQKRKMGNGWEATDEKAHTGAGVIPRVQKFPVRRKPQIQT